MDAGPYSWRLPDRSTRRCHDPGEILASSEFRPQHNKPKSSRESCGKNLDLSTIGSGFSTTPPCSPSAHGFQDKLLGRSPLLLALSGQQSQDETQSHPTFQHFGSLSFVSAFNRVPWLRAQLSLETPFPSSWVKSQSGYEQAFTATVWRGGLRPECGNSRRKIGWARNPLSGP